jgi:hypothetical protein
MEEWNAGILGIKAEVKHYNCEKLLQTHYSVIPIGAKPLSLYLENPTFY